LARLHHEPALLQALSENCEPPKSITAYVDELLCLYEKRFQDPRYALAGKQVFSSYIPADQWGYIAGWTVIGSNAPKRISLIAADKEIGSATQFPPRPDV